MLFSWCNRLSPCGFVTHFPLLTAPTNHILNSHGALQSLMWWPTEINQDRIQTWLSLSAGTLWTRLLLPLCIVLGFLLILSCLPPRRILFPLNSVRWRLTKALLAASVGYLLQITLTWLPYILSSRHTAGNHLRVTCAPPSMHPITSILLVFGHGSH